MDDGVACDPYGGAEQGDYEKRPVPGVDTDDRSDRHGESGMHDHLTAGGAEEIVFGTAIGTSRLHCIRHDRSSRRPDNSPRGAGNTRLPDWLRGSREVAR
jgi:hypothetical protein